ncbi:MAG: hypothetical protein ABI051_03180 [Vicinamibacterales bacterium]
MRNQRSARPFRLAVMLATLAAACHDTTSPTAPVTNPQVTGVSPAALQPTAAPQVVTVSGSRFLTGLALQVVNPSRITTTISGGAIQLLDSNGFTAAVPFPTAGTYTFTVRNPNTEASTPFPVVVRAITASTPTLTAISPAGVPHSSQAAHLTLQGTNLGPGLTVSMVNSLGTLSTLAPAAVTLPTSTTVQLDVILNTPGLYGFAVSSVAGEVSNYVYLAVS